MFCLSSEGFFDTYLKMRRHCVVVAIEVVVGGVGGVAVDWRLVGGGVGCCCCWWWLLVVGGWWW